ncbi:MAG: PDZ domain-containing protein, partial [Victivallales bacterium]|nr:PDZ domain-containing protein [Victivallales bacterium]
ALLKLQREEGEPPLPVAKLRRDWMQEGDFVMTMGAPWGMSRSVSVGIISCARRYLESNGRYTLWYQTDAAIAPGNSGGPLIDTDGRIVGINTLGLRGGGSFGFTIPSPIILDVLDRIRRHGGVKWAWFGFELQPLHDFDRNIDFGFEDGVIVANAEPGSPARLAGFEPNDRILAVNGQPVNARTEEELPEVRRRLGLMPAEVPARFRVMRGEQELTLLATPGEKGQVEGNELVLPRWGFTAKSINKFDNPSLSFYVPDGGVFVYGLRDQGNALRAGLRRQDIILTINGQPVPTLEALSGLYDAAMANLTTQNTMAISLLRNGRRMFVALNYATEEKP